MRPQRWRRPRLAGTNVGFNPVCKASPGRLYRDNGSACDPICSRNHITLAGPFGSETAGLANRACFTLNEPEKLRIGNYITFCRQSNGLESSTFANHQCICFRSYLNLRQLRFSSDCL